MRDINLSEEECEFISDIGNNKGCMELKGANPSHTGEPLPDRWSLNNDLEQVAQRWSLIRRCIWLARMENRVEMACFIVAVLARA